jgi:hypothetical protein
MHPLTGTDGAFCFEVENIRLSIPFALIRMLYREQQKVRPWSHVLVPNKLTLKPSSLLLFTDP